MNIEIIARKLEPLFPFEIRKWERSRNLEDAELRNAFDNHLLLLARRTFGDLDNKIILSMPKEETLSSGIVFGTLEYHKPLWKIGITNKELLQHMAIFGRAGSGKTNTTFYILNQLIEKQIPFLFFDWKRTARHLIPLVRSKLNIFTIGRSLSPLPFNPFVVPPNIEKNVHIQIIVDVLADAFTLGVANKSIIHKAMTGVYKKTDAPNIDDIILEVNQIADSDKRKKWKDSAIRALESLKYVFGENKSGQEEIIRAIIKGSTILELDGLSHESKAFIVPALSYWIYNYMLGEPNRETLKMVIFIEEAHNVLHSSSTKESILEMLIRQCREIGIGMVIIDQEPHLISSAVLANTYTSIFMNLKNPADVNVAAGVCSMDASEKHYFQILSQGQGIVKLQDRWKKPFLISIPKIEIDKGLITDDLLKEYLIKTKTTNGLKEYYAGSKNNKKHILPFLISFNKEELDFINDILKYPEDGVAVRYMRLGNNKKFWGNVKRLLVSRGIVQEELVRVGMTHRARLSITDEGKALLCNSVGGDLPSFRRAGAAHEYWKSRWAGKLADDGWEVNLEAIRASSGIGKTDILGRKCCGSAQNEVYRTLAVEIETGKSNAVWNVKQNLLAGYDSVLVVCTDEIVLKKIEHQLSINGLLLPDKVNLVLADKD